MKVVYTILLAFGFAQVAGATTIRFAPGKSIAEHLSDFEQNVPRENIWASHMSRLELDGELTFDLSALPPEMREPLQQILANRAFDLGDLRVDMKRARVNFVLARAAESAPRVSENTAELLRRQEFAAHGGCALRLDIER